MSIVLSALLPWHWPILRLFRRPTAETDYEVILSSLAAQINDVQKRLTSIRQRERRASITIPFYVLSLWAIYTALCVWMGWLAPIATIPVTLQAFVSSGFSRESHHTRSELSKLGHWLPILITPVLILFARRILRWWYERIANAEERQLKKLRERKRNKIDEIKKATRYDHLRMLLDRYDDKSGAQGVGAGSVPHGSRKTRQSQIQQKDMQRQLGRQPAPIPVRQSSTHRHSMPEASAAIASFQRQQAQLQGGKSDDAGLAAARRGSENGLPESEAKSAGDTKVLPPAPSEGPAQNGAQEAERTGITSSRSMPFPSGEAYPSSPSQHFFPPQQPLQPRTFLDKVADLVLGPDPSTRGPGPEQRYALICPDCKRHNGLCMKEDWEEIQYICPNCGHFNSNRPSTVPSSWPASAGGPRNRVDSSASITSFLFSTFGGHQQTGRPASGVHSHAESGPSTPATKVAALPEGSDQAHDSSQHQSASDSSDSLHRSNSGLHPIRKPSMVPEEDNEEILMTPRQDDEKEIKLGALRRRNYGRSARTGKQGTSPDEGSGSPQGNLLDEDAMDVDQENSMERHRR